jgi:hypothetical protein
MPAAAAGAGNAPAGGIHPGAAACSRGRANRVCEVAAGTVRPAAFSAFGASLVYWPQCIGSPQAEARQLLSGSAWNCVSACGYRVRTLSRHRREPSWIRPKRYMATLKRQAGRLGYRLRRFGRKTPHNKPQLPQTAWRRSLQSGVPWRLESAVLPPRSSAQCPATRSASPASMASNTAVAASTAGCSAARSRSSAQWPARAAHPPYRPEEFSIPDSLPHLVHTTQRRARELPKAHCK